MAKCRHRMGPVVCLPMHGYRRRQFQPGWSRSGRSLRSKTGTAGLIFLDEGRPRVTLNKIFLLLLLLPATALGAYESDYLQKDIKLDYRGEGTVVVVTKDLRAHVLSGDKKPEFVGLIRGIFGNPADVRTKSRRPLTEDFSASIAAALTNSGFSATSDTVAGNESAAEAIDRLVKAAPDRIVIVQLRDWKTDSYRKIKLHYDLTISIYDRSGAMLENVVDSADEEMPGVPEFTSKPYVDPIVSAYRGKLAGWLNHEKVRTALGAASAAGLETSE